MTQPCEHLSGLSPEDFPPQRTPDACEECLTEGTFWVALRECRSCGHVGCCDSSTGKHASKHFHDMQHPVMRAIPPAAWTWCYVHEAQGVLEQVLSCGEIGELIIGATIHRPPRLPARAIEQASRDCLDGATERCSYCFPDQACADYYW